MRGIQPACSGLGDLPDPLSQSGRAVMRISVTLTCEVSATLPGRVARTVIADGTGHARDAEQERCVSRWWLGASQLRQRLMRWHITPQSARP